MTNPPPPPASAMGLVAEWNEAAESVSFVPATIFRDCAADLAAALSLSEEEREIVDRIAALPSVAKGFEPDAYIGLTVIELDTLRALIARTYELAGETP